MPIKDIPRKNFIILTDENAAAANGIVSYTWQIPDYWFSNWRPNDRLVMRLVFCSAEGLSAGGAGNYSRNITYFCDVPATNINNDSRGTFLGGNQATYQTNMTLGTLPTPFDMPELLISKFQTITIGAYTSAVLNYADTTSPATGSCTFVLEISYFDD